MPPTGPFTSGQTYYVLITSCSETMAYLPNRKIYDASFILMETEALLGII